MAHTKSLGELLIASLGDAIAFEEGRLTALVRTVEYTAQNVQVDAPPRYDSVQIRTTRLKLGYSQHVFARALNVNDQTVKAWEQGNRVPDGPTLRLLEIAEQHPEVLASKVHPIEAMAAD